MHIISDSSQYNYKKGETWFIGNVRIDQGNTHLIADRVVTKKNAENKIQEAVAYGIKQLAHYWMQPQPGEKQIHAQAKIMHFYPLKSRIVLKGDVFVTQGENHFKGQIIVYNIEQRTLTVPPTKNSRSTFVIDTSQIKEML